MDFDELTVLKGNTGKSTFSMHFNFLSHSLAHCVGYNRSEIGFTFCRTLYPGAPSLRKATKITYVPHAFAAASAARVKASAASGWPPIGHLGSSRRPWRNEFPELGVGALKMVPDHLASHEIVL